MNTLHFSHQAMSQRLLTLAQLYQQGAASELMERILVKLFVYEADACRAQLTEFARDLAVFEERYSLPSNEFYRRYQSGQTDDRMDYVEWASLIQMTENLRQRLRLLTGNGGT